MVHRRPVRPFLSAVAAGLLLGTLGGCSGAGDDGSAEPTASRTTGSATTGSNPAAASGDTRSDPSPPRSPSPTPSAAATKLDFTPDPSRAPKTRAQALRLARSVAAEPVTWGPGFVKRSPYENDPDAWPVLDKDCVWQLEPVPATVLASLTRNSELPAEGGKGPIRVTAVVSVHRTVKDATWEMAGTLEETLRCPEQQLRQGERITELASQGADYGLLGNFASEDTLTESGKYSSDVLGGPHYYYWVQSRMAQVTVAVVGKGAEGRSEDEVDAALLQGVGQMLSSIESELEAAAK
ncbi:hypothetical protein GCM10017557_52270 [Streptomyces aurantiacus]|uniref:Lipoprotein n=1 Tax=Streptomyces aurantiacus TaxID=47760 RepID=A0A7G1P4U1_9ACTN|nr:hypothetical protein GCM10017557_52270 [Streptomyces aurantiacus]